MPVAWRQGCAWGPREAQGASRSSLMMEQNRLLSMYVFFKKADLGYDFTGHGPRGQADERANGQAGSPTCQGRESDTKKESKLFSKRHAQKLPVFWSWNNAVLGEASFDGCFSSMFGFLALDPSHERRTDEGKEHHTRREKLNKQNLAKQCK